MTTIKSRRFEHAGRTYEARDESDLASCLDICIFDAEGQFCDMIYPGGLRARVNYMVCFHRPLTVDDGAVIDAALMQAEANFRAGTPE